MIFKKSITAKFIAAVFIILLIGQSVTALMLFLHTKSALFESLEKRMRKTADITAGVSSVPLLSHDYAMIDTYIEKIMKDEDISSLRILGRNGKVVREKIKTVEADFKTLNPFLYKKTMSMRSPVTNAGEKIGEVILNYTPNAINENISGSIAMISLYQGIMLLGVSMVMVFLFNRNIKKPVSKINKTIKKITTGDLSTDVPYLGENEIGSIAKGITFLTERLSRILSKLNSNTANVSMAIKQVEMLYKNVINGITKQSNAVKELIESIQNANKSQSEIIVNTEKLSSFSTENVSSLLQMKATADEIASNTKRLYKATEVSYSVIVEMTQTAKSISKSSNEAVSAVENTSASVEEIGASIKEVEEHARKSSRLARNVKEITSDTGMPAVVNAVEGMDKISAEVKNSADIMQRLGSRSKDIEKILSVIKDVTEQTNLLSLNAAILAAQAGEYGKSFSVVADEIRALSERTASSTREIAGIVKTIQRDIKDAAHSIDTAKLTVVEENSLVLNVGDALREILTASEHSTEMTKAIEQVTREQSTGLNQIKTTIEDIRQVMDNVAGSTGKQKNSLSYLLEGAGEVKEVADITKRGTEEQAAGTGVISRNLELANDRVTLINQTGMNQKKLNNEIIAAMEDIDNRGIATVKDMEEVSYSLKTLFEEVEILKKEMEVFKIKQ